MVQDRFIILPSFSLKPNQLALFRKFVPRSQVASAATEKISSIAAAGVVHHPGDLFTPPSSSRIFTQEISRDTLAAAEKKQRKSVAHNFELSKQARKNLRDKVTWLYHFAKSQTVTTVNGKVLSNFRMNFVTLKLPSVQAHTSDFITKNCLNQLLIELTKKYGLKNYVWRLEYQKNGNLHYHIACDIYIDFYYLRNTWNRILSKHGYVQAYTKKFEKMSFNEYYRYSTNQGVADFELVKHRYDEGFKTRWCQPNSVDVKSVIGSKNIAFYISKYMSKKEDSHQQKVLPVCEDNSAHSRLWFCSRSLSRCKSVSDFCEAWDVDLSGILSRCEKVKKIVSDYATVYYFSLSELPAYARSVISGIFSKYRQEVGYDNT